MRLYSYRIFTPIGSFERFGVEVDGRIVDLNLACATYSMERNEPDPYGYAQFHMPPNMVKFFEGGEESRKLITGCVQFVRDSLKKKSECVGPRKEQIVYDFSQIKLMAPVPRPNIIRDCMVFLEHFRENWAKRGWVIPEAFQQRPFYNIQSGTTVAATGDPVWMPRYTEQFDFEMEFGLYIGRKGINIPEERAKDYIAGFTIYNDFSARDVQAAEMQMRLGPTKGKNFEHSNIMGPCLVTPDELDYDNLRMIARVNGDVIADDNSKDMYHKFPKIISFISEEEYLYPGDFIASGTSPHGTTHASTLKRWLKPGDIVEIEIERIGIIRNEVTTKGNE